MNNHNILFQWLFKCKTL